MRAVALAAEQHLGPGGDRLGHALLEHDGGRFVDDCADAGRLVGRIAHGEFPGLGHEPVSELIEHRLLDKDALDGGATLAGVTERPLGGERRGEVEVSVLEHNKRRVAAQLETKFLIAGDGGEVFSRLGAACESDQIDARIAHERLGDCFAIANERAEHRRRQTSFVEQLGEADRDQRRLAGRLEQHRHAGGDRRGEFVRHLVERVVERRDRGDQTQRLAHGKNFSRRAVLCGVA